MSNENRFESIKGIGTIILNNNRQILVGTETKDKPAHRRTAGMTSIPIETVKPFERRNEKGLLLAGLAEVVTDDNIGLMRENLHEVGVMEEPVVVDREHDISAAVAVFHWKGDPEVNPFLPAQADMGRGAPGLVRVGGWPSE